MIDWRIKGPEFNNCNCNYGCPCQFNALPTHGHCRALAAMRIEEGHFGSTKLDGLNWVGTFAWPGAVHEGNGTQQFFIDERADADQRAALVAILHGRETQPGATHLPVFNSMVSHVLDPQFTTVEVDLDVDACCGRVAVPGLIESSGTPIRNPFTGNDHRVKVSLKSGFEYTEAEFGSCSSTANGAIKLALDKTHGHFAHMHLTGNGVVR